MKIALYEINDNKLYPVLDTAILILEKDGYSKLVKINYEDSVKVLSFTTYENMPSFTSFNHDYIKDMKGVFEYKGFLFYFYNNFDNRNDWIKDTKRLKEIPYYYQKEIFIGDLAYTSFQFEDNEFILLTEKE